MCGTERDQKRKYLILPGEVKKGFPKRGHLSWALKDEDEWAVRIRPQSSFIPSTSDTHIFHSIQFPTWGISPILDCGEIHSTVFIQPQMHIFYLLIWEPVPLPLKQNPLGWQDSKACQAARRKLLMVVTWGSPKPCNGDPENSSWLSLNFCRKIQVCVLTAGKKVTKYMQYIWKERNTHVCAHTYTSVRSSTWHMWAEHENTVQSTIACVCTLSFTLKPFNNKRKRNRK